MRLVLEKDEVNCFWVYARNEKDMQKALAVVNKLESYGYVICHIDETDRFIMLSSEQGVTQSTIREDYIAAKV